MSFPSVPAQFADGPGLARKDWLYRAVGGRLEASLLAAIFAAILAQFALIFIRPINWDEFYFLSRIYEYRRGELSDTLQTFHVHLFSWLTVLPVNEIGQIVVARLVMLVLELGTLALIYRLARKFALREAALIATAGYALLSNTILHGASFRFDPIATFLLMSALLLLVSEKNSGAKAVCSGLLIATAGLVTIKAVFYLPPIIAIAVMRWSQSADRTRALRAPALGATTALAAFVGLHFAHRALLAGPSFSHAEAFLSHSVSTMLGVGMLRHNLPYLEQSMLGNPIQWLAIAGGIAFGVGGIAKTPAKWRNWVLLSMAFPLAVTIFYRNAYPYFYVFALAPAGVLMAVAIDGTGPKSPRLSLSIVALMCLVSCIHFASALGASQRPQQTVLQAVHQMFPTPVAYIDKCSMVGSFRKAGFFMSSWLTEQYYAMQTPSFRNIVRTEHPVFVLANSDALASALLGKAPSAPGDLLARDVAALHANFIHHWGPIWVAGKNFDADAREAAFEISIPGKYTLESAGPVLIDGSVIWPGGVINLDQRRHAARASGGKLHVVLRWGNHLGLPDEQAPREAMFNGF